LPLLSLVIVKEISCTHLETCECHEIKEIVNAAIEQAIVGLESNLTIKINKAVTRINVTDSTSLSRLEQNVNSTMTKLDDMEDSLKGTIEQLIHPIQLQLDYHLPQPQPADSCKEIHERHPNANSGYYVINTTSGPTKVYCKMDSSCANMTGGWMRIAYLDMKNSHHQCPSALTLLSRNSTPTRVCDINHTGCASTFYTVHGKPYSHVYGRIIGYQKSELAAFWYNSRSINENYVYGVSLTHGQNPRKHIWTFAGALDETTDRTRWKCPCTNTNIQTSITIHSFVGNDYFCDTSYSSAYYSNPSSDIKADDPLWDGRGCGSSSTCCSVHNGCGISNSPPWFIKQLKSPTTDSVEMRLCKPHSSEGTTPIEVIELYVQ
jgi:hypothetical protein